MQVVVNGVERYGVEVAGVDPAVCSCPWTDPATWTRYGGAIEPGSTRVYDPECLVHGRPATPGMSPWRAATYIAALRGQFGTRARLQEVGARAFTANLNTGRNPR